ncbi:MAG TPA: DUF2695 domain-containing protein [Kineosporiaceae bacterium]|nr:DUF2695 domain-containing protein [Kineosporiaceae bacterium]
MVSREEQADRKALRDDYLRAQQARSAAFMPLDRPQLEALLAHVDDSVFAQGCDHTLRAADAWAATQDVDLAQLHRGLEEYGGFCDCGVMLSVDPEYVFTPLRTSGSESAASTPNARRRPGGEPL